MNNQPHSGEGPAIASLVLGIISCLSVLVYLFSRPVYISIIIVITGFLRVTLFRPVQCNLFFV